MTSEIHHNPEATEPVNGKPKRQTRHYAAELLDLKTRVGTALLLLAGVKVEKSSADVLGAVMGLLKGK